MKQTVNEYQFTEAFKVAGRGEQFSYDGLKALYEYLEGLAPEEEYTLDVIALCCEFQEFDSLDEYCDQYDSVDSIGEIEEKTTVIRVEGGERFIILQY